MIFSRNKRDVKGFFAIKASTSIFFSALFLLTTGCFTGDDSAEDIEPEPIVIIEPEPDPSELTGPTFGDLPEGLEEANHGAFEGGETGTGADTSANNVLQALAQRDNGKFNVPTNGAPSPLFGAEPFTQQIMRFEEFGPGSLNLDQATAPTDWAPLPAPENAVSIPDSTDLESFLSQDIWPIPTKYSNTEDANPWQSEIESYLGQALDTPPAEGRPPGLGWSHQR